MTQVSLDCQNIDCQELYEGDAEDSYDTYWFTCPKCECDNEQVHTWK